MSANRKPRVSERELVRASVVAGVPSVTFGRLSVRGQRRATVTQPNVGVARRQPGVERRRSNRTDDDVPGSDVVDFAASPGGLELGDPLSRQAPQVVLLGARRAGALDD